MRIGLVKESALCGKPACRAPLVNRKCSLFALLCLAALFLLLSLPVQAEGVDYHVTADINNTNWMSAIPDGRAINEINIPGVHDACAWKVWNAHLYGSFDEEYAITQHYDVKTLLNSGVRMFDLRFTNCQSHIEDAVQDDLFLCHGGYHEFLVFDVDGLYYCCDADGYILSYEDVMSDVHQFLMSHPSETVILSVKIEYEDEEKEDDGKLPNAFETLRNKLDGCSEWMYMDGSRMPTLGEVRGKAVLVSTQKTTDRGLYIPTDNNENAQTYTCNGSFHIRYNNAWELHPDEKADSIKAFYAFGDPDYIPKTAEEHLGFGLLMYTSSNNWGDSVTPMDVAKKVNAMAFTNSDALFDDRSGFYFGWVFSDFVTTSDKPIEDYGAYADYIWRSNYPDDEDYYATVIYMDDGEEIARDVFLKGTYVEFRSLPSGDNCWVIQGGTDVCPKGMPVTENLTLEAHNDMAFTKIHDLISGQAGEKSVYIKLEEDVLRMSDDKFSIDIPQGMEVELDLNGHSISGGGRTEDGVGYPLFLLDQDNSRLTIHGPGVLKDGYGTVGAGAISIQSSSAEVYLDNLSVEENIGETHAGAIAVEKGSLSLKNVSVRRNKSSRYNRSTGSDEAGGIEVWSGGHLSISGKIVIKGNSMEGNDANIGLGDGSTITVDGALTEGTEIWVHSNSFDMYSLSPHIQITEGYGAHNSEPPATFFRPEWASARLRIASFYTDEGQLEAGLANSHTHQFTYSADPDNGSEILSVCTADDCYLPEIDGKHTARLTLCAPAHSVYGDGEDANASLSGIVEDMEDISFTYLAQEGENWVNLDGAPTLAGTYTVQAKIGDAEAKLIYSISKRPVKVSGIRAEDKVYDGTRTAKLIYSQAVFTGMLDGDSLTVDTVQGEFEVADVQYKYEYQKATDGTYERARTLEIARVSVAISDIVLGGEDADQYTIDANRSQCGTSAHITPAPGGCTPPEPISELVYDGTPQEIAKAGTAEGGTMVYAVVSGSSGRPDESAYSETLPTQTDAGIYFIWYKVIGDGNHTDTAEAYTIARIGKASTADVGKIPEPNLLTYNGDQQVLLTDVTSEDGTWKYLLATENADGTPSWPDETAYEAKVPTARNAGTYLVKARFFGDENHDYVEEAVLTCVIGKAAADVVPPVETYLEYTGAPQALLGGAGSTTGGTILYWTTLSLTDRPAADAGSEEVPTATDAGLYVIWYRVAGDDNHLDSDWEKVYALMTAAVHVETVSGGTVMARFYNWDATEQGITPESRINLTATPELGYALTDMKVMCGETSVNCTQGENGVWKFLMPAGDATVTPVFEKVNIFLDDMADDVSVAYLNSDGLLDKVSAGLYVKLGNQVLSKNYYRVSLSAPDESGKVTVTIKGVSPCAFTAERTFMVTDRFGGVVLNLPRKLTLIEDGAFEGMGAMIVKLPHGNLSIGSCAFAGDGQLQLNVPDLVGTIQIEDDAFEGRSLPVILQASPGNSEVKRIVTESQEGRFVYLINR